MLISHLLKYHECHGNNFYGVYYIADLACPDMLSCVAMVTTRTFFDARYFVIRYDILYYFNKTILIHNWRSLYWAFPIYISTEKNRNMLFMASWHGALLIMPRLFASATTKLRFRAFFWCIICFCTIIGSFRILKKAGENILFFWLTAVMKMNYRHLLCAIWKISC